MGGIDKGMIGLMMLIVFLIIFGVYASSVVFYIKEKQRKKK